jgi:hypothetical protein
MDFDQKLALLGKDRRRVIQKLKRIFPIRAGGDNQDPDLEIEMRVSGAFSRPASWEFRELQKGFSDKWLAGWFQAYVGGLPDPTGKLDSVWVKSQLKYSYEAMKKPESARAWAEVALGLRLKTNRMHFGGMGFDLNKMDPSWLDQECKYGPGGSLEREAAERNRLD